MKALPSFLLFCFLTGMFFLNTTTLQAKSSRKYRKSYSRQNSSKKTSSPEQMDISSTVSEQTSETDQANSLNKLYDVQKCKEAIDQDDPQFLEKVLGKNPNYNIADSMGETLLQNAVRHRRIKCINYLISHKANVNCQDKSGLSPIYLCSRDEDVAFAEILINAGARTSFQERSSGWNVFHKAACDNYDLKTLKVLIRERSGLNMKDDNGMTPLHLAVTRKPRAILVVVDFLLSHGARVNEINNKGQTPLDLTRQKEIVNCLLRYGAVYGDKYRTKKYYRNRRRR